MKGKADGQISRKHLMHHRILGCVVAGEGKKQGTCMYEVIRDVCIRIPRGAADA